MSETSTDPVILDFDRHRLAKLLGVKNVAPIANGGENRLDSIEAYWRERVKRSRETGKGSTTK